MITQLKSDDAWEKKEELLQIEATKFILKFLHEEGVPKEVYFHVPNEGQHKMQYRVKQKMMGVQSGVSDIILLLPRGNYHGMIIEIKKKGGRVSPTQKSFCEVADSNGYFVVVTDSLSFLQSTIKYYVRGN